MTARNYRGARASKRTVPVLQTKNGVTGRRPEASIPTTRALLCGSAHVPGHEAAGGEKMYCWLQGQRLSYIDFRGRRLSLPLRSASKCRSCTAAERAAAGAVMMSGGPNYTPLSERHGDIGYPYRPNIAQVPVCWNLLATWHSCTIFQLNLGFSFTVMHLCNAAARNFWPEIALETFGKLFLTGHAHRPCGLVSRVCTSSLPGLHWLNVGCFRSRS